MITSRAVVASSAWVLNVHERHCCPPDGVVAGLTLSPEKKHPALLFECSVYNRAVARNFVGGGSVWKGGSGQTSGRRPRARVGNSFLEFLL